MAVLNSMRQKLSQAARFASQALKPPTIVIALALPIIVVLMVWVFLLGNKEHPFSYVAYALSAYLFTVLCVWIVRRFPREGLYAIAAKNRMVYKALEDVNYRRQLFIAAGITVDVLWSVVNFAGGIFLASIWLITLGVFYLLCAVLRGVVFWCMGKAKYEGTKTAVIERFCGALLLLSVFALSGIVCLVIKGDGGFSYEGVLIYAVATFAFYSLIVSIVNYVRLRGHENVLVVLNCRINLAVVLVSIFALEVAMLAQFGTSTDVELNFFAPIITGAVIALIIIFMGVHSIVEAGKNPEWDH